jgi:toxin ParE1/3/4
MKVHWTDRAKLRLKHIHDHIAKDAPLVAPSVIERLVRRSIQIGEFPHSGREAPEY